MVYSPNGCYSQVSFRKTIVTFIKHYTINVIKKTGFTMDSVLVVTSMLTYLFNKTYDSIIYSVTMVNKQHKQHTMARKCTIISITLTFSMKKIKK